MKITQQEFEREHKYQMTMLHVRGMFKEGLISEKEYREIDTRMIAKYAPVSGGTFSEINLLLSEERANMDHAKEVLECLK